MNPCQRLGLGAGAVMAALVMAGCVVAPPAPLTEMALARTAIEQAEQAGAAQSAPNELASARQHLADAERVAGSDVQLARWRAREAESDARLAEATAQDVKARTAVAELDKSLNAIRAESRAQQP